MQNTDTIVLVDFKRKPGAPYTKVWKRLTGTTLEQRVTLPSPLLTAGNLLEMTLDGTPREFRIEHLRWEHARQTLHVHLMLTEREAASLSELGIKAWRPWLRRRALDGFLERCRQSGWLQRGGIVGPAAKPVSAAGAENPQRVEPTL